MKKLNLSQLQADCELLDLQATRSIVGGCYWQTFYNRETGEYDEALVACDYPTNHEPEYEGQGPGWIENVVVTPPSGITNSMWYQAASWANSAYGQAFTMATAGDIAGLLPAGFKLAGNYMAVAGAVDNGLQWWDNPNWIDATQAIAGAAVAVLAFTPAGGTIVVVASTGLFVWELVETANGWDANLENEPIYETATA